MNDCPASDSRRLPHLRELRGPRAAPRVDAEGAEASETEAPATTR